MDPSYEAALAGGIPIPPHQMSSMQNQLVLLQNFWQSQLQAIEHGELDFKNFQLPLARIKKVMKTDDDVKVGTLHPIYAAAGACKYLSLWCRR